MFCLQKPPKKSPVIFKNTRKGKVSDSSDESCTLSDYLSAESESELDQIKRTSRRSSLNTGSSSTKSQQEITEDDTSEDESLASVKLKLKRKPIYKRILHEESTDKDEFESCEEDNPNHIFCHKTPENGFPRRRKRLKSMIIEKISYDDYNNKTTNTQTSDEDNEITHEKRLIKHSSPKEISSKECDIENAKVDLGTTQLVDENIKMSNSDGIESSGDSGISQERSTPETELVLNNDQIGNFSYDNVIIPESKQVANEDVRSTEENGVNANDKEHNKDISEEDGGVVNESQSESLDQFTDESSEKVGIDDEARSKENLSNDADIRSKDEARSKEKLSNEENSESNDSACIKGDLSLPNTIKNSDNLDSGMNHTQSESSEQEIVVQEDRKETTSYENDYVNYVTPNLMDLEEWIGVEYQDPVAGAGVSLDDYDAYFQKEEKEKNPQSSDTYIDELLSRFEAFQNQMENESVQEQPSQENRHSEKVQILSNVQIHPPNQFTSYFSSEPPHISKLIENLILAPPISPDVVLGGNKNKEQGNLSESEESNDSEEEEESEESEETSSDDENCPTVKVRKETEVSLLGIYL